MNTKPSLRDRRRRDAIDALYRAQERRDEIIGLLIHNANRIRKLKRQLAQLDKPVLHTGNVSVAEGKILDPYELKRSDELNDDVPDLGGGR